MWLVSQSCDVGLRDASCWEGSASQRGGELGRVDLSECFVTAIEQCVGKGIRGLRCGRRWCPANDLVGTLEGLVS